jgi:hypothetical protein
MRGDPNQEFRFSSVEWFVSGEGMSKKNARSAKLCGTSSGAVLNLHAERNLKHSCIWEILYFARSYGKDVWQPGRYATPRPRRVIPVEQVESPGLP